MGGAGRDMERPEIKLGLPQRELEEPQRELKLREPWPKSAQLNFGYAVFLIAERGSYLTRTAWILIWEKIIDL